MHMLKHLRDERNCKICKMKFDSLSDLSEHIGSYHNDNSIDCPSCHKKFTSYDDRKIHKHTSQCGENLSVCKECGFYTSQACMRTHKQYHKSSKDAHQCEHCSYSAPLLSSLELHLKVSFRLQFLLTYPFEMLTWFFVSSGTR